MSVKVEQQQFYGWDGYRLSAAGVSVGVVPAIGGRIISLKYHDEELFFVQEEHQGELHDFREVDDLRAHKRKIGFRVWGGNKTWIAPEKLWWEKVPPLELDAGQYDFTVGHNFIEMTSPICRETGSRIIRRVTLTEKGRIILNQTLVNESPNELQLGIWSVTQCLRPFDIYWPVKLDNVYRYTEEAYEKYLPPSILQDQEGWTKISCRDASHFKLGALIRGVIVALKQSKDGTISFVKTFRVDPESVYAHNVSAEIYNSPKLNYLEIETHSPLAHLKPGGALRHEETWILSRFQDREIAPAEVFAALSVSA